ncbi:MAG: CBS domain-containing protein [Deltaproteobacteria bacterium]|nr:CBS domain-containing protein [Deltaproteobacteria bacterium]MBW2149855.1 CBS domain-containing protein [Deltaproteobacteria bacterium]MBW2311995.1 CBS domain-containing protein [Deltaproteobacteria bacterium]
MKVRDIMRTNVVTVTEDTLVTDAKKIMDAHRIRRLPVMKKDKLVGLVTRHMLLEAAPSPATSLNIWEMHYLLSKMTVKEIMVKNPSTIPSGMLVEEALELGQEKGFGAFPVMDDGRLVGMVTESDIVRMMTRVLGVKEHQGVRIDIRSPSKEFGYLRGILDILDKNKALLLSMMTLPPSDDETDWLIALRVRADDIESIANELKSEGFNVSYAG